MSCNQDCNQGRTCNCASTYVNDTNRDRLIFRGYLILITFGITSFFLFCYFIINFMIGLLA